MFNLEKAIEDWRRQMLAAGIKTPVPLEELEGHLREELERQRQSGWGVQQAFEAATRQIGQAGALKSEFEKNDTSIGTRFVELTGIAWGVITGLFSLWILLVLFTVHEVNWAGRMLGLIAIASTVLSWRYGYRVLPVIHHRWVRTMIGFSCCLVSILWMGTFVKLILPSLLVRPANMDASPTHLMIVFLWAWTVAAVLAGVAQGLKKAASRQDQPVVS